MAEAEELSQPAGASAGASSIGCAISGSALRAPRNACLKVAPSQIGAMASTAKRSVVAIVVTVQARASAVRTVSGYDSGSRKGRRLSRDAVDALLFGRAPVTPVRAPRYGDDGIIRRRSVSLGTAIGGIGRRSLLASMAMHSSIGPGSRVHRTCAPGHTLCGGDKIS